MAIGDARDEFGGQDAQGLALLLVIRALVSTHPASAALLDDLHRLVKEGCTSSASGRVSTDLISELSKLVPGFALP